jgi:hypothetical protein
VYEFAYLEPEPAQKFPLWLQQKFAAPPAPVPPQHCLKESFDDYLSCKHGNFILKTMQIFEFLLKYMGELVGN